MVKTQCEKQTMNAIIGKRKIVLITSSLTSLMQSTDTQISAHPLCGLGWIPNKINNTKKPRGSFGNFTSDYMLHCFPRSNFSKLSDLLPFEMPMHNNFYPWLETQRRLVKALKNVFEEVKQITSEYQNVKFLNKGIQSFRGLILSFNSFHHVPQQSILSSQA